MLLEKCQQHWPKLEWVSKTDRPSCIGTGAGLQLFLELLPEPRQDWQLGIHMGFLSGKVGEIVASDLEYLLKVSKFEVDYLLKGIRKSL